MQQDRAGLFVSHSAGYSESRLLESALYQVEREADLQSPVSILPSTVGQVNEII